MFKQFSYETWRLPHDDSKIRLRYMLIRVPSGKYKLKDCFTDKYLTARMFATPEEAYEYFKEHILIKPKNN